MKRKKVKGSVLYTVVSVMMIMTVFIFAALTMASAANKRAFNAYANNQTQYTARSVVDSICKAINSDKEFAKKVAAIKKGDAPVPVSVKLPDSGMGKAVDASIANIGTQKDNGFGDSLKNVYKISATVQMMNQENTVVLYATADTGTKSGKNAAFDCALVSVAGSEQTSNGSILGGFNMSLNSKMTNDFQLSNDGLNSGFFGVNGSVFDAAHTKFELYPGEGVYINGDYTVANTDNGAFIKSLVNRAMYTSLPYFYVENNMNFSPGTYKQIGEPDAPVLVYAGAVQNFSDLIYGDMYLFDENATSTFIGSGFAAGQLFKWTGDLVNKLNGDGNEYVGGNIYSKGTIDILSNAQTEGDLIVQNLNMGVATNIGGATVIGNNLTIKDSPYDFKFDNGLFVDPDKFNFNISEDIGLSNKDKTERRDGYCEPYDEYHELYQYPRNGEIVYENNIDDSVEAKSVYIDQDHNGVITINAADFELPSEEIEVNELKLIFNNFNGNKGYPFEIGLSVDSMGELFAPHWGDLSVSVSDFDIDNTSGDVPIEIYFDYKPSSWDNIGYSGNIDLKSAEITYTVDGEQHTASHTYAEEENTGSDDLKYIEKIDHSTNTELRKISVKDFTLDDWSDKNSSDAEFADKSMAQRYTVKGMKITVASHEKDENGALKPLTSLTYHVEPKEYAEGTPIESTYLFSGLNTTDVITINNMDIDLKYADQPFTDMDPSFMFGIKYAESGYEGKISVEKIELEIEKGIYEIERKGHNDKDKFLKDVNDIAFKNNNGVIYIDNIEHSVKIEAVDAYGNMPVNEYGQFSLENCINILVSRADTQLVSLEETADVPSYSEPQVFAYPTEYYDFLRYVATDPDMYPPKMTYEGLHSNGIVDSSFIGKDVDELGKTAADIDSFMAGSPTYSGYDLNWGDTITENCTITDNISGKTIYINPGDSTLWIRLENCFVGTGEIIIEDSAGGTVNFFVPEDSEFSLDDAKILTRSYKDHMNNYDLLQNPTDESDKWMIPNVFFYMDKDGVGKTFTFANNSYITGYIMAPSAYGGFYNGDLQNFKYDGMSYDSRKLCVIGGAVFGEIVGFTNDITIVYIDPSSLYGGDDDDSDDSGELKNLSPIYYQCY